MQIDVLERITLDRYSGVPLYRQLADQIRSLIDAGELAPGETLPGEQPMADELGIDRDRVRQALQMLADEGLIIRKHGSPTMVAPRHVPTVKRGGLCLATLVEKTPGGGPGVLRHVCHLKAGHEEDEPHRCAAGDLSWSVHDGPAPS